MKKFRVMVIVSFLFFLATSFGQQPRVAPRGDDKKGSEKKKEKKERKHQVFRNHWGDDTFNVEYCLPGRLEDGRKGQTKGVPCGCVGMYTLYWESAADECNMSHDRKSDAWKDCQKSIKGCSEFMEHGGDSGIWTANEQLKCQVYCYEKQSCRCCDDKTARQRMDKWHKLTLAGMVAWKTNLRLLNRGQACNERFVFSYQPIRPPDLFYSSVVPLLW